MGCLDIDFYKGKRVFVTGHTGFKGSWLCRVLVGAGATVTGYSLTPPTQPNLYSLAGLDGQVTSIIGDIRDLTALYTAFHEAQPDIVLHLAAQPIVRDSYRDPRYTYETNVMGTVNILECVRQSKCVKSFLNVTTDKVYKNHEWVWGYREDDPLDGYDPYSNSKSCSELVTHSYKNSFFTKGTVAVSTVRAGNVIGGGDFAHDRIIPDCVRSVMTGRPLVVRNPHSVRPYEHVLEPVTTYLMVAARQCEEPSLAGWYNVGPDEMGCVSTGKLVELFRAQWGDGFSWVSQTEPNAPHEDNFLKLDCSKLRSVFGWKPRWDIEKAVQKTAEWTRVWLSGGNIPAEMDRQIAEYLEADD